MFKVFSSQKHSLNVNTSPTFKHCLRSVQYVTCQYFWKFWHTWGISRFSLLHIFCPQKPVLYSFTIYPKEFSVLKWLTQFDQSEKFLSNGLISSLPLPPQQFRYLLRQVVENWDSESKSNPNQDKQLNIYDE